MMKLLVLCPFLFLIVYVGPVSAQNQEQTAYGVLIDNTGSMRTHFESAKGVGKAIAREIIKHGPAILFSFESSPNKAETSSTKLVLNWSQDGESFENALDGLRIIGGQTTLSDAAMSVSNAINAKMEAEENKYVEKVLILVTDGEDRGSETRKAELVSYLEKHRTKVYIVGFLHLSTEKQSKKYISELIKVSGGHALFPKCEEQLSGNSKSVFVPKCDETFEVIAKNLFAEKK